MIPICYLKITTFGVLHTYGRLEFKGKQVEITKKLTKKEADQFNKYDKWKSYKAGYKTGRLRDEKEVIKFGKQMWKKLFPSAIALIRGSSSYVEPQLMLMGPKKLLKENNELWKTQVECGGWEYNPKLMQEIYQKWKKLVNHNYV